MSETNKNKINLPLILGLTTLGVGGFSLYYFMTNKKNSTKNSGEALSIEKTLSIAKDLKK